MYVCMYVCMYAQDLKGHSSLQPACSDTREHGAVKVSSRHAPSATCSYVILVSLASLHLTPPIIHHIYMHIYGEHEILLRSFS